MAYGKTTKAKDGKMSESKKSPPPKMMGKEKMKSPPMRPGMKPKSVKP